MTDVLTDGPGLPDPDVGEGGSSIYTDGSGLEALPLTYTLENDTDYDRTEVVGVMAVFPDGPTGIAPAAITDYCMYFDGGRETIGFGIGTYPNISRQFDLTLPWTGPLNTITAASGNIRPGSCKIDLYYYSPAQGSRKISILDTQSANPAVGSWVHPAVEASSINYTTGVVSIRFAAPYTPASTKPIRLSYQFASPDKHPTQWTVLRTWPSGFVRQAKAWVGRTSGVGLFIPKRIQSITATVPANTMPREYTRAYLRIGYDPAVNALLPTYTQHAEMAAALNSGTGSLISQVYDSNGNQYFANLLSASTIFEENVVEDPANNGGKGWMKVIQRRSYHTPSASSNTFTAMTRDFLSCTAYLYAPHNNRLLDAEIRLGNDYQGTDPVEHSFTESLGTGNGVLRSFSAFMTHVYPSADGIHGHLRKGRVRVYVGSTLILHDKYGNGNLESQNGTGVTGTVNYQTGQVSINFPTGVTPPGVGVAVTCTYKTHYIKIGTASGVATVNYTLPTKASQYGIHVRVGGGSSSLYEGWDGGGAYNAATSQIVPYVYTTVDPTQLVASPVSTTQAGTVAADLVPGTVGFFLGTTPAGGDSVVWCRDNGSGALSGRGVSSGTIDYVTGAYSITFSGAPAGGLNLYATYGTIGRYISGSINYSTRALSVTTTASVPSNTPIFVAYLRNNLSGFNHDPNMHPLGAVGLNRWVMLFSSTKFTGAKVEGAGTYQTSVGSNFATIISDASTGFAIPPGGANATDHEHMADGTGICRLFQFYTGVGGNSADNNTWAAKQIQPITTMPTLDAYNATSAYGLLEGKLAIITPEQVASRGDTTKRTFSEDLGRWDVDLTNTSLIYTNKASLFSCVPAWNFGSPVGHGGNVPGQLLGARSHLNWKENLLTGVNQGGGPRASHDFSCYWLYPQAWQGLRYAYHASLFNLTRPATTLWNIAMRSRWEDRAYVKYIATDATGMLRTAVARDGGTYGYINTGTPGRDGSQEYLNRGWRFGWSEGSVVTTYGSTRIEFTAYSGLSSNTTIRNNWNTSGTEPGFYTPDSSGSGGPNLSPGRRRIAIQGSYKTYTVTGVAYDSAVGRWVGTLSSNFDGPTSSVSAPIAFGLFLDPITGRDIVGQRTDPRVFPVARIGCRVFNKQHGTDPDCSSHQAQDVVFDAWCGTGSWQLWDMVRHRAEWNMASVKEFLNGKYYQDQQRTNAWTHKSVICAYTVVKHLTGTPGFSFLTDSIYGAAPTRYREWSQIRWSQWHNLGARGVMDPYGTIAVNGKERINGIRITSHSDKASWYSMADVTSPNPAHGGGGTYNGSSWVGPTEANLKFDDLGFDYISVWEIGYLAPWAAASYREFQNDITPIDLPNRGETAVPFNQIMRRIFNAYASFVLDYGWIAEARDVVRREDPGTLSINLAGTGAFPGTKWNDSIFRNVSTATGTPMRFVTENAGTLTIAPTWSPVSWPTLDDNYIAMQVYWLRGASRTVSETEGEAIDALGWPIPGKTPPPVLGTSNLTTFERGWHYNGMAFQGNPIIPVSQTNPNNDGLNIWPECRAPVLLETFNVIDVTHQSDNPLIWGTVPFLMHIYKFHASADRRSQAADYLNRVLGQARAMSLIIRSYDNNAVYERTQGLPIEQNQFLGPVTGDYPYSTSTNNQPLDRWYDTNYAYRRKITSGTSHVQYVAGLDIFSLDLDALGIDVHTLQTGGVDIRVVRQLGDGTNQVCKSIVRKSPTNQWALFVSPPTTVSANQPIQANASTESWYIYYGNPLATAALWDNAISIDGPYASDSNTRILWNQNGNYATDAGPNNWPVTTVSFFEPDYADGPFGGAISLSKPNFDIAYSRQANQVAASGPNYLGANFTFDFQFRIDARKHVIDSAGNYGLFGVIDEGGLTPFWSYIENPTRRVVFSMAAGGAGSGYTISTATANGPSKQTIGTGNGSLTSFSANLGTGLIPGKVSIASASGTVYGVDNGSGVITGTGIAGGSTVNYANGNITVVTSAALPNTIALFAFSTRVNTTWAMDQWNQVSITYNGQQIITYVNGVQVGSVLASGSIQPIPVNSQTYFSLGSLYSPGNLFTALSTVSLAEFRVSNNARGTPRKITSPLMITLLGEESHAVARQVTSPSVSAYIAPLISKTIPVAGYLAGVDTLVNISCAATVLTEENISVEADVDCMVAMPTSVDSYPCEANVYSSGGLFQTLRVATLVASPRLANFPVDALVTYLYSAQVPVAAEIVASSTAKSTIPIACSVLGSVSKPYPVAAAVMLATQKQIPVSGLLAAPPIETTFILCNAAVAAPGLASNRTLATVAIPRTHGNPGTITVAAVQVSDLQETVTVDALIGELTIPNLSTVSVVSDIAVPVTYRQLVAANVVQASIGRLTTLPVIAAVREDNISVDAVDVYASVMRPLQILPIQVDAAVQKAKSVNANVSANVRYDDNLEFANVDALVWVAGNISQIDVAATLAAPTQVPIPVWAGVRSDNLLTQLSVDCRVLAEAMLESVPITAYVRQSNVTFSQQVDAEVVLHRSSSLPVEISFEELYIKNRAVCEALVWHEHMLEQVEIEATIAETHSAGPQPVAATVAMPRTSSAVCRCLVVVELSQNLNASGVHASEGGRIQGTN